MFLKEKRCGRVKGRGCADGRKQRIYKTKEETSSPTISLEALFITCIIDAMERRSVTTVDIPGAFMQADIDEKLHIKLEGDIALLLVRIDPSYKQYLKHVGRKQTPVVYALLMGSLVCALGTNLGQKLSYRRVE